MDENKETLHLSRRFGMLSIWAFSIGTSIGWGSLVVTCNTYLAKAGVVGTIVGLLIVLIFPIYALYNIINTFSNLKIKNYAFYKSVITDNVENGYLVQGIKSSGVSYIDKTDVDAKKAPGTPVIVAVMKDEIDLLGM